MIGLVLVTHGRLAEEFVTAMIHVVGPQERVATIAIGPDDDMEERRADIAAAIADVDTGRGVIVRQNFRCVMRNLRGAAAAYSVLAPA